MRGTICVSGTTLVAIALTALALGSAQAAPGDPQYVALGDSVSAGNGATTTDKKFVNLLYADYQSSLGAGELLNRAMQGATGSSLRNGGQLTTALADINGASDTVAVTLGIGGNDALSGSCPGNWDNPAICQFRADFAFSATQVQTALNADPGTEPFTLLAYYNPRSGIGDAGEASFDRTLLGNNLSVGCLDVGADVGLNDVVYQEAGNLGLKVADAYTPIKAAGQSAIASDKIHTNDSGHAAIAQAFRDAATRCTGEPRPTPNPNPNPNPDPTPADTDPPQTKLLSGPAVRTFKTFATFRFKSDEPGSAFRCRLDGKPAKPCRLKRTYRHLAPGRHVFRVVAKDTAGNLDKTPALKRWKVLRRR